MKRKWEVCRQCQPYPDGEQRWDRAYQHILQWAAVVPQESSKEPHVATTAEKDAKHADSSLCTGLYPAPSPESEH